MSIEKFFLDHKASPAWAVRRRIIILSMLWEAVLMTAIVAWAFHTGDIGPFLPTAFINLSGIFAGTLGSYVFGAVWDDKDKRRNGPPGTQ